MNHGRTLTGVPQLEGKRITRKPAPDAGLRGFVRWGAVCPRREGRQERGLTGIQRGDRRWRRDLSGREDLALRVGE